MYDHKITKGGSCNSYVNDKGKVIGDKGAPKSTTDGKSLSPDATNALGVKFTNKMLSPGPGSRNHGS